MALDPETRAKFVEIQLEMAKIDPIFMTLDIDNEEEAMEIVLAAAFYMAIQDGESILVESEGENGQIELISIAPVDTPAGKIIDISVGSDDGTIDPDTAEMVAGLINLAQPFDPASLLA